MFIIYLISFFVFMLGLCIGSFLNCVIYRMESEKTLKGRSFCPNCKHILSWYDLFPVFSFLFLSGKCRYCSKKISWQYPLVEISTALLFLFVFIAKMQYTPYGIINLIFLFYIVSVLAIIFVYDLKHYIIPDKILFPAIIIAILYDIASFHQLLNNILAVVIAAGFFYLIYYFSKGRAMGFGDVKLAVLMGLLLGFPNIFLALFLAFFFGAIIGIMLMVLGKKGMKSEIPFGPFLIIGTFITVFLGNQIVQWYLNFIKI